MPTPEPLTDFSKLCLHTITTKPWPIEVAMDKFAEAEIGGITVWRQWLEGRDISKVGDELRDRNLEIVSLCRGGFFSGERRTWAQQGDRRQSQGD